MSSNSSHGIDPSSDGGESSNVARYVDDSTGGGIESLLSSIESQGVNLEGVTVRRIPGPQPAVSISFLTAHGEVTVATSKLDTLHHGFRIGKLFLLISPLEQDHGLQAEDVGDDS